MKVRARAKINLTLEVLGNRPDGYHDLRSVVMPVSLEDDIEFSVAEGISCSVKAMDGINLSHMGPSENNLAVKAARILATEGRVKANVGISIAKRIPLGGGMGGGSADAAAVLIGLNDYWELGFTRMELATIGAWVGSDVPALALGGVTLMEGRGEKVSPLFGRESDTPAKPYHLVLVNPGVFSSTPAVFKASTFNRELNGSSILDNMRSALAGGDVEDVAAALNNDLAEAAYGLYPEIARTVQALKEAGAIGVSMSGSGATVFGLVRSRAHGREVISRLGGNYWCRLAHTCPVM